MEAQDPASRPVLWQVSVATHGSETIGHNKFGLKGEV